MGPDVSILTLENYLRYVIYIETHEQVHCLFIDFSIFTRTLPCDVKRNTSRTSSSSTKLN